MTTGADKLVDRLKSDEWGKSREFTTGIPIDGDVDPTGEYPKRDYFFSSSINQAARGAKVNRLYTGGSCYGVNFDLVPQKASSFPFSQVHETPSGHVIEIDDTPGGERVLVKHATGAGIEIKPDGTIVVVAEGDRISVVSGDEKMVVNGTGQVCYDGNFDLHVTGDYNLSVGGNFNLDVGSSMNQFIYGSHRTEVSKTSEYVTQGSKNTKTFGKNVDINLSEHKIIEKDRLHYILNDDLTINTRTSIQLTAENEINTSSNSMAFVANTGYFTAPSGKVGGAGMMHVGNIFTGPGDDKGTSTTFYGSLVGRALEAWTSRYSLYAEESFHAHISNYATIADQADFATASGVTGSQTYGEGATSGATPSGGSAYDGWTSGTARDARSELSPAAPAGPDYQWDNEDNWHVEVIPANDRGAAAVDTTNVSLYLNNSPWSIKRVQVDEDGILSRKINKLLNYGNMFDRYPTLTEIRSKLRSFTLPGNNLTENEQTCIDALIAENRINGFWNDPLPSRDFLIRRYANKLPDKQFGYDILGDPYENRSKQFVYNRQQGIKRTIVVDPAYNPDAKVGVIKSDQKLAATVPLSRFLGSEGDRTSLDYIPQRTERVNLLRQLYLQANILDNITRSQFFKDHRMVVSESFYVPTIGEDITNGHGHNALKRSGRAVVYQLLNTSGRVDYSRTFELADYIKNHFFFDELILDYDNYAPDGILSSQIILIMPEVDSSYTAVYQMKISTHFNRSIQSADDLLEIIPEKKI